MPSNKLSTAYPTGGHVTRLEHHRRGRPVLQGAVFHQQVGLQTLLEVLSTVPLLLRMHVASTKPRGAGGRMSSEEAQIVQQISDKIVHLMIQA